ncbi:uncharacterized protein LOC123922059 [Trifolium pratense]|uniref:uncharacterized protein LOC123922059 n=1 Tax=Trifolium pratense TaxID=57577 RepID=UPI001E690C91|nr:uncharacterized protein LOC123922059 [Trifolium pratense]
MSHLFFNFLRSIKKEEQDIIKQQHTPTITFSFLFFSLKKDEPQNNNNHFSSILTHEDDVTDDDRVCLHFSIGDPSCPTCDCQQQLITNNKRKRSPQQQQLTLKNKKTRIIIKQQHKPTTMLFSSLFSSLKNEESQNNKPSSFVVTHEDNVTDDDRVCLPLLNLIVPVLGGLQVCENRGVHVRVWDIDINSLHSLVFTIRPSNQSHIFKDTWIKDFVLRRNLQVEDEIGLIWDRYNQNFVFSVLRACRHHQVD